MIKIILASNSPQRRKLLKLFGLRFQIKPSRAHEATTVKTTCADLVKHNALLKAKDIARKVKEGIVLGADTLVYLGQKRIVGKPRTLKEAKRILKILSRRPHFVYTGLALVDAKTKRTIVDYEKTKIYMQRLTDEEIDSYHRRIFPLDKAGGFDVQGKGALFMRRIEGCYFNVVGLPVAKLYQMLKKLGVRVLFFLCCIFMGGCVTEYNLATQQEETFLYGTDKEVAMGENIARRFEQEFKINRDIELNRRVSEITRRIEEVCDRQELVYTVKIIDEDKVNAVSLPGGFIYVYKGLIDRVKNDDQLAGVIAHEIGHITARHSIKKLQSLYGYTLLKVLAIQSQSPALSRGVDAAFATIFTEYSQEDEFLADRLAVKYLKKVGYNPDEMVGFLKVMKEIQERELPQPVSYWRTHPNLSQRIAAANQAVSGEIQFKDYLNLLGGE